MTIKIPREKINKIDIVNVKGGIKATQLYKKYKPDYMINLALYDMATGINITHLKDEGVASGYLFSDEGIGIKGNAEIIWTTKDDKTVRDFVAGSPVLVKNGQKCIDWGNKKSEYVCGSHIRSTIGFNADEIILFTSDEKMTLNELVENMKLGRCQFSINLDGGGSSHLQMGSAVYKKSTRKNASWLLVYLKQEEFEMYKYTNNSNKSLPVYETTACKKKIGSLDPYETCNCLYEDDTFKVVLYNITGKAERKVGFIKG